MLVKLLLGVVGVYVALLVAGYLLQRRMIYVIDPVHVAPAAVGLVGVTELVIDAPDSMRVLAWYARAKPGQPTLLYFHGNASSPTNTVALSIFSEKNLVALAMYATQLV